MKNLIQILVIVGVIYFLINFKSNNNSVLDSTTPIKEESLSNLKKVVIEVRGLGDISQSKLNQVSRTIEKFYGFRTIVTTDVDITEGMYIRNTKDILNASICLKDLNDYNTKTIYVTNKELWASGDMVNGLAFLGGNTVVVTTTSRGLDETVKHEIGHIFGLGHCTEMSCVMASENDQYETGKFCKKCKNHFIKKFNINE